MMKALKHIRVEGARTHNLKNITLENNGVDITTAAGSKAKAVFKGSVSAILSIPGQGEAVLVNHGERSKSENLAMNIRRMYRVPAHYPQIQEAIKLF